MYKAHNLTIGEFRTFFDWSDLVRYLADCEDQGYEVAYVKEDCVEVKYA
jgi:hypothetical protein